MELSIQERLKYLRVERDLTPEQTAESMDVPVEYVNVCCLLYTSCPSSAPAVRPSYPTCWPWDWCWT